MENLNQLSKNIIERITRIEDIIKVNALARKCNLNVDTVAEILNGNTKNPGIYTVAKIAEALDCSVDELVSDSVQYDDSIKFKVNLIKSCVTEIINFLIKKKYKMALDDFLAVLEEIYLHSLNTNAKVVDAKFAETCINNFFER